MKSRLYSVSMTHRVGAKGQVVIPQALRERLGLQAGTPVDFEDHGNGVLILPAGRARALRGRFERSGMASRLLDDRAREPR